MLGQSYALKQATIALLKSLGVSAQTAQQAGRVVGLISSLATLDQIGANLLAIESAHNKIEQKLALRDFQDTLTEIAEDKLADDCLEEIGDSFNAYLRSLKSDNFSRDIILGIAAARGVHITLLK